MNAVNSLNCARQETVTVHLGISPWAIRRVDTGIDEPVVAVLQRRNVDRKDFFGVIRKADLLYFDTNGQNQYSATSNR